MFQRHFITHLDFPLIKLDVGVGNRRVEVQVLGDVASLDRQDRLDESSHASRALEMTNIGLDGANVDRLVLGTTCAEGLRDGKRFLGVASWRARAVALNIGSLVHVEACILVESPDVGQLRVGAGHGDA